MAIESRDPGTGELLESFEAFDDRRIGQAIADAEKRFAGWRLTPFARRADCLARAAAVLDHRRDEFAEMASREMGKTFVEARAELEKCAFVCRHYSEEGERYIAREDIPADKDESYVAYQPLGPILAIMPWNFPFWQVFRFAAPAIAAGNVALLKHASNVPRVARAIEDVFAQAGLPEHVFQTLLIGADKVKQIIADRRVAAVTLTGSSGAGSKVAAQAGESLKKAVLELGGSDPFIVMPSADFGKALETGLKARMMNNGQSCINAKRFIVHAEVYDDYLDAFVAKMDALKIGYQMRQDTDVGPLALKPIRDQLESQVKASVKAGAKRATKPREIPEEGYYYPPTVLTDIPDGTPARCEELFGPVASFFKAKDIEEAVALANDTPFGLGASAWTQDRKEAQRFVRDLEAGSVFINLQVASDPRLPFGGVKQSGFGRELDGHGIREFVNVKTIAAGWGAEARVSHAE